MIEESALKVVRPDGNLDGRELHFPGEGGSWDGGNQSFGAAQDIWDYATDKFSDLADWIGITENELGGTIIGGGCGAVVGGAAGSPWGGWGMGLGAAGIGAAGGWAGYTVGGYLDRMGW